MNPAKQWWLSLCLLLLALCGGTMLPFAAIACTTPCLDSCATFIYDGHGQTTPLSNLIAPGMGNVNWAACLEVAPK